MRILKKFKKRILLMIFSIIFSATALNQTGLAITLVTTNEDFYYQRPYDSANPSTWTYYPDGDVYAIIANMPAENSNRNFAVPYFNFDLDPYIAVFNASTTVKLNLTTSTSGIQTPTVSKPASFDVFLTDWTPPLPATINTPVGESSPIAKIGASIGSVTITSVYGADQLLQISLNKSSISSYLSTHSNNLKILIDPDQAISSGVYLIADFQGLPSDHAAQIELDGYPVPEPSSMVLGLIGLGGILVFNKNKGKLL